MQLNGLPFLFFNLEETRIHHTNMFSTFAHPSLLKDGCPKEGFPFNSSIQLSFRQKAVYKERSLYSDTENKEPVAAAPSAFPQFCLGK